MSNGFSKNSASQDVSLIELLQSIWNDRKLILKFLVVGLVLGVVAAFISPKEWETKTKLVVKASTVTGSNRSLSRLAGIAGFSLGVGDSESISPLAYEDILKSDELVKELLETTFYASTLKDSVSLRVYLEEHQRRSVKGYITYIPSKLMKLISGGSNGGGGVKATYSDDNTLLIVSASDELLFKRVKNSIISSYDEEKGIFEVGYAAQDPMIATLMTQYLANYLEQYVADFLSRDEKRKVDFISEQLSLKKTNFEEKQAALAAFRDSNLDLTSNSAKSEEERLMANYNVAFNVYNSLEQSLEEAKIALAEQESTLKPLGPVKVPVNESKPNKLLIIIAGLFLAAFAAIAISLFRLTRKKYLVPEGATVE